MAWRGRCGTAVLRVVCETAAANVPIRMLQHYEQRVKALDKAAFDTVFRLARVLHVPPQNIVEPA